MRRALICLLAAAALAGPADDLFFRARVGAGPVTRALDLIRALTESGIPFLFVPGNH